MANICTNQYKKDTNRFISQNSIQKLKSTAFSRLDFASSAIKKRNTQAKVYIYG